ncbi:hypothetical protein BDV18DRAFT_156255 [Aspergillus unguis]
MYFSAIVTITLAAFATVSMASQETELCQKACFSKGHECPPPWYAIAQGECTVCCKSA